MTRTWISLCLGIVFGLGVPCALFAEKVSEKSAIPPDFLATAPEVPADQNHLTPFLAALGSASEEFMKQVREARSQMASGTLLTDESLLHALRERHKLADELLKPPLAFTSDAPASATLPMYFLFQGTAVLARQAMLENDYPLADRMVADLLRWSHLLRNAQPNEMQYAVASSGWQIAFDTLLQDWRRHPDPAKRLAEIESIFRNNQLETAELIETQKSEARWWIAMGGVEKMLRDPAYAGLATHVLKPPFNDLSNEKLLKLPYDEQAGFDRYVADVRKTLVCIRNREPLCKWPDFEVPANQRTFADYQKLPNGLGDLFHEQRNPDINNSFWANALSRDPLMEACLLWLKLEQNGQPVVQSAFDRFLDPVDGKPLVIDVQGRNIRTRGADQKIDLPVEAGTPLPSAGFAMLGDDSVMLVPKAR